MKERDHYQQKMHEQFDEWSVELAKLGARAKDASEDVRDEMQEHIESLEKKLEDGRARLGQLGDTTGQAWGSVRDGVESAWGSLKTGFQEAAEKVHKA